MEIVIVLVGTAVTAITFWLMARSSRRRRDAIFDAIRQGPMWETRINFHTGESTTKRIR
jgi:hypothetical protein